MLYSTYTSSSNGGMKLDEMYKGLEKREFGKRGTVRLAKWTHRGINREHITTPARLSLP